MAHFQTGTITETARETAEYHYYVPVLELMLAFEAAKNALAQAKERAQQAVTAKLSAARPAQDELLRLDALTAEGY